ncbi:MAG: hypothetical protein LBV52_03880 [Spirochaetaceae bacterium]|nr:hypothetical protein [Spirochaetaceae bacterium]
MRNIKEIEKELAEAKEDLSNVKGTTAEVYSRIVGYYRSVRNWNKGKREEYSERLLYNVGKSSEPIKNKIASNFGVSGSNGAVETVSGDEHVLLFVRPACPSCPGAKLAAGKLGIPVDMVNADTEEGLAEATRLNVMSTPTAILFAKDGKELSRARDSDSIAALQRFVKEKAAS